MMALFVFGLSLTAFIFTIANIKLIFKFKQQRKGSKVLKSSKKRARLQADLLHVYLDK